MITGPADTPVALTLEAPETDASNQNGSNISAGADIPLEPFNGSSGPGDAPQKRSGPPVVPSPKGGGHVGLLRKNWGYHQQPEVNYLPCFENDDLPCRLHEKHVVCRVNHQG